MNLDLTTFLAILGMAIVTYFTRIGGLVLVRHIRLNARLEAALQAVPPAVLMAVIAPTALATGPAETIAAAVCAFAALRAPLLLVVIIGVGTVVAVRFIFES